MLIWELSAIEAIVLRKEECSSRLASILELYSARIGADQNLVFVEYVGMQ